MGAIQLLLEEKWWEHTSGPNCASTDAATSGTRNPFSKRLPRLIRSYAARLHALCTRPLTRRLIHQVPPLLRRIRRPFRWQAYKVFVELAMHRRQYDVRQLDSETFGRFRPPCRLLHLLLTSIRFRKVHQCSQRYLKIMESGCRAMESAAECDPEDQEAGKEHFTFRAALTLWELYDILYCRKPPVVVKEHEVVRLLS